MRPTRGVRSATGFLFGGVKCVVENKLARRNMMGGPLAARSVRVLGLPMTRRAVRTSSSPYDSTTSDGLLPRAARERAPACGEESAC
jgi:hypothetical protein